MRQLVQAFLKTQSFAIISALVLGLAVAGCGHKSTIVPTTITVTPAASISLQYGQVEELTAQVYDNNGNLMTNQVFTWTSSNTGVASVSGTGGQCGDTTNSTSTSCICAGTWDSSFINCQSPSQAGTATITVTSTSTTGTLSTTLTALVHQPVAQVAISPNSVNCLSANGTQQLTAHAYNGAGQDITNQVAIDTTSFSWTSSDSTVVSINSLGLATAVNPGIARVYAAIAGTTSAPSSWTTCPVVSLTLAVSGGSGNTFSIAQAATQQLTATAVDSNHNTITITSGRLSYPSSFENALSVDTTGLVTAQNPGSSAIVASCSPPICNNGLYPVYSNVVFGTGQGTTATGTNATGNQVLVASPTTTTMIPYDSNTNTVGFGIILPYAPNSLVYSRVSATAYLGSNVELMSYTYTAPVSCTPSSTVVCTVPASAVVAIPGTIVELSSDALTIVLYNDTTKTVTVYSLGSSTIIDQFIAPGATPANVHASTSPDGETTFVVAGNQLYVSSPNTSLHSLPLNSPATDVAFLLQGSFAYLAGGESNAVSARATCNATEQDVIATAATPDRIIGSADGTKVFAVAGSVMNTITATTNGAGCPPSVTDSLASTDLGLGTITPSQIFTDSGGKYVFMISSAGKLISYNPATNTATTIALNNNQAATSAGVTMDGATLWVGSGSDDLLHNIDPTTNTDTKQINVGIPADLIAVRNE